MAARAERSLTRRTADLSEHFELAAARAGIVERSYRIGDHDLRLRFAGPALARRLTPSLEHLRREGGDEHVARVWDAASTGGEPPKAPLGSEQLPPSGLAAAQTPVGHTVFQKGVGTLSVLDLERDRSWYWAPDASRLPEWECATPLRHLLHLWLAAKGVQFVHAGAVGTAEGGLIVVGKSGSGKSTTTLSTLGSDLLYAGDDYVAVSLDREPQVHSVFGCAKVEPSHLRRLPDLRILARREPPGALAARRDKIVFLVRDTYPEQVTSGFPLKGIVVPRIDPGGTTQLREIAPRAAALSLVPSTMFEIHGTGQGALTLLARVAEQVPAYELRLGSDLHRVPAVLERALAR